MKLWWLPGIYGLAILTNEAIDWLSKEGPRSLSRLMNRLRYTGMQIALVSQALVVLAGGVLCKSYNGKRKP